jgi:hypothetical protein
MLSRGIALACLAISCSLVAPAAAQDAPSDSLAVKEVKSNLRNLVVAMEAYFAEHMAYTANLEDVDWEPEGDVTLPTLTLHVSGNGWAGTMGHKTITSVSCSIYIGASADNAGVPEGAPQCVIMKEDPAS